MYLLSYKNHINTIQIVLILQHETSIAAFQCDIYIRVESIT